MACSWYHEKFHCRVGKTPQNRFAKAGFRTTDGSEKQSRISDDSDWNESKKKWTLPHSYANDFVDIDNVLAPSADCEFQRRTGTLEVGLFWTQNKKKICPRPNKYPGEKKHKQHWWSVIECNNVHDFDAKATVTGFACEPQNNTSGSNPAKWNVKPASPR